MLLLQYQPLVTSTPQILMFVAQTGISLQIVQQHVDVSSRAAVTGILTLPCLCMTR